MTNLAKDIANEPNELIKSLNYTLESGSIELEKASKLISETKNIVVCGIGSSWHAGMAVCSLFEQNGIVARLYDASELLHYGYIERNSIVIILSRSGESVEIVRLIKKVRDVNGKIIGISNTESSSLIDAADFALMLNASFDFCVSITMYSALTLVGCLLVESVKGNIDEELTSKIASALADASNSINDWRKIISKAEGCFMPSANTYFLARGSSLASAYESRLLWEEAAKTPATAMGTGNFRHGPQEVLLNKGKIEIGLWMPNDGLRAMDVALVNDLKQHGAKTILIGEELDPDLGDVTLNIPTTPDGWNFLVDIIPMQLAAEYLASVKNQNCDKFEICSYIISSEFGL